jgi:hypothetical protein
MLITILIFMIPPFIISLIMLWGYLVKPAYIDVDFHEPPALSWINSAHHHWDHEEETIILKNNQPYKIQKDCQGHFVLLFDWKVNTNLIEGQDHVIIPAGITTDLASIPKWLRSFLNVLNNSAYAAIMHDYYYRNPADPKARSVTKEQADQLFYWGMREAGVNRIRAGIMYLGVYLGGKSSYIRK